MDNMLENDIQIVESIFDNDSSLKVKHEYGYTRKEDDFQDALENILETLEDKEEEIEYLKEEMEEQKVNESEMLKHIKKLEKMLFKREAKFKSWEEVS